VTGGNKAADSGPKFCASGKKLAWRAQKTIGYEADKWDILISDCTPDGTLVGKPFNVTERYGVSVNEFVWNGSSDRAFLFTADFEGRTPVFITPVEGKGFDVQFPGGACGSLSVSNQRNMIAYTVAAMDHPAEVVVHRWADEK